MTDHRSLIAQATRLVACGIVLATLVSCQTTRHGNSDALKVFILAGQSNMQGQGVVEMDHPEYYNGGKGNLVYSMKHSPHKTMYTHLKDADGKWTVRDDVWVRHVRPKGELHKGDLTVGYTGYGGRSHIGPELQFGHHVGNHYDQQVLLIKTAWGGKSLHKDFRPPSSGGETGVYYTKMLQEVQQALSNLNTDFPGYDESKGYEIAGFVWFQGWNDMFTDGAPEAYEDNMVNLIKDVRAAWKSPALPVVIGELGNGGENAGDKMKKVRQAQAAAAERPENGGSVKFVSTTAFARPKELSPNTGHGHHWFGNAESYFLIGDALGKGMLDLLK
jgi:hypothetical protein